MIVPTFQLAVNGVSLDLIEFDGIESMNRLFEFVFTCSKPTPTSKLVDVIDGDAVFTIKQFDTRFFTGDLEIPGYISKASKKGSNWVLEFHPKIKKTGSNCRSEIYFDNNGALTARDVIQDEIANDIVIEDRNFVNSIGSNLPGRKLFCQYNESNFNFVARLCDHWGIQYYFDHNENNIVLSDMDSFDHFEGDGFSEAFKTTAETPDNSILKLRDWSEGIKIPERYITVIGHDHQNAGTEIISSYPDGNTAGLTESRLNISGVQSQAEADYLAQIRYQAENCKNHLATATSSVPYLHPGFLIATDDCDFDEAIVIKTIHRARNLDSHASSEGASYECDVEMIPVGSNYRPDLHYPIPQASTVLGHTITDATDSTLAQRNESGEYKVKFMGFESGSTTSSEPWIRKAQTTGGSNSVDVPLTPNTEVLLAFVDNNLDCPYIQHAMDNSLHPLPVTNVNAHHAVISTDGMLVTSSLQGRYSLSTTRQQERVDDDTVGGGDVVNNLFKTRGGDGSFKRDVNFIDPSATIPDFTPEDRASGDYIISQLYGDQIQINYGDRLHWHNGNLYDFGGYWNYNLGNSYEENFIDQTAPLNIKVNKDSLSGDILNTDGPAFSSVDFSAVTGGKLNTSQVTPASHGNDDIETNNGKKTFQVNTGGAWGAGGLNVSKSYNASYDYKFGDEIDISDRVNSLSVKYTDASTEAVDVAFHEGKIRSWEKLTGRNSESKNWAGNGNQVFEGSSNYNSSTKTKTVKEKKWDLLGNEKISDSTTTEKSDSIVTDVKSYNFSTGALASHNIKKTDGMGVAEMDFSYSETAISKFDFGGTKSFSLSAQGDASIAISFSGSMALSVGFGLSMEVKTGVEMAMNVDLRTGSSLELDAKGKLDYSGIGFKARSESRASAENKMIELANTITTIAQYGVKINQEKMKFTSGGLDITSSFTKLYM
jgi:uncharacterized protein involved in type VI secretion and phage assembly